MLKQQICPHCGNKICDYPTVWQKRKISSLTGIEKYSVYDSGIINSCDHCKALLYNKNRKKFEKVIFSIIIWPIIGILALGMFYSVVISLIAFTILILFLLIFNTVVAPKVFLRMNNKSNVQSYVLIDSERREITLKPAFTAKVKINVGFEKEFVKDNIVQLKDINQSCHIIISQLFDDNIIDFSYVFEEKNILKDMLSKKKKFSLFNGQNIIGYMEALKLYEW